MAKRTILDLGRLLPPQGGSSTMDDQLAYYAHKLAFEIDSWDLDSARRAGDHIVVIDARSPEAFAREHIPDAINLPHRTMSAETTATLERGALIVVYCDGIGCNASTKGALKMAHLGFQVKELIGGLDWWKRDGHPTHDGDSRRPSRCGCT
jgi:rhodanese-related sulfurtransferase